MARPFSTPVLIVLLSVAGGIAGDGRLWARPAPEAFADLFAQYRSGNAEAAVDAFAKWSPARVDADAVLPDGVSDARSLAALAVLHTEAGMRNHTYGLFEADVPRELFLGFWGLEDVFEVHSFTAYRLIRDLAARAKKTRDEQLLTFCRRWYIVSVSYCMRWDRQCDDQLVERGEHDLDGEDDAEYLLLLGAREEGWLRHRDDAPKGPALGQYARWALKKALDLDPSLVEARMRLGRLYHMAGEDRDAQRELEQALAEARRGGHLFATHMAALTLGELHEEAGRMDRAIEFYRAAVESYPRGHTAAVALGQALVRTGQAAEGWSIARQMFATEGAEREAALDPYAIHRAAQYWQNASAVRALRETVRR